MILEKSTYLRRIRDMTFTNYDGWGHPAKLVIDEDVNFDIDTSIFLAPSNFGEDIPDDYNFVQWTAA